MQRPSFPSPRRVRDARGVAIAVLILGVLWGSWSNAWPAEPAAADPPPVETPEPELPTPTPTPAPPPPEASPAPPSKVVPKPGPRVSVPGGSSGSGSTSARRHPVGPPEDQEDQDCSAALAGHAVDPGSLNSTGRLVRIVSPLERRGIPLARALQRVAGPFPVAGEATWADDWHAARCNPSPHLHMGIDIFARAGTPLVAVADARITQKGVGAVSGLKVEIRDADGVEYFYAHLSGFAPGLALGQVVETGDVLGYMGTTGNAVGTSPHVHFEIQPHGVAVPPKPFVDRWIATAERRARRWVRSVRREVATAVPDRPVAQRGMDAARLLTLLDPVFEPLPEPSWGETFAPRALGASPTGSMWTDPMVASAALTLAAAALVTASRRLRSARLFAERRRALEAWSPAPVVVTDSRTSVEELRPVGAAYRVVAAALVLLGAGLLALYAAWNERTKA